MQRYTVNIDNGHIVPTERGAWVRYDEYWAEIKEAAIVEANYAAIVSAQAMEIADLRLRLRTTQPSGLLMAAANAVHMEQRTH